MSAAPATRSDTPSAGVRVDAPCAAANCVGRLRGVTAGATTLDVTCDHCGAARALSIDAGLANDARVTRCPACDGVEFFVRRDFPQRLGLAIVMAAGLASCVLFATQRVTAAWGVLAGAVVVDAALAIVTGKVTVCYRCRAEFRGVAYNADHAGFDLATSEKYPRR